MQKVIPLGTATAREAAATATSRVLHFPETLDRTNRTFICAVVFMDLVEYGKKPVAEQLQVKDRLNSHISGAIRDIAASDRIILDTGDGVAINFLGDPEDALFVAMNLAQGFVSSTIEARIGVNVGPVRLVRDVNNQPNIIGDGINVAHHVMSFAQQGQVLVSGAYYDAVTRISEDYTRLFAYQGSRTDKHVREHEVYEIAMPAAEAQALTLRRKHARGKRGAADDSASSAGVLASRPLAYAATILSIIALAAATFYFLINPEQPPQTQRAQRPAPAKAPPPVAPSSIPVTQPEVATAPPVALPEAAPVAIVPVPPVQAAPSPVQQAPKKTSPKAAPRAANSRPNRGQAPESRPDSFRSQPATPVPTDTKAESPEPIKPVLAPIVPALASPAPPHIQKPATGPTAVVLLAISPWGEVFVDGKLAGISPPMSELELTAGKHRIEVRNGNFKPYQEDVDLTSNQTTKIKHKFAQGR
jgi:PEGA domain/Adenylate and Guanylate cyclase catalytic domain